MSFQSELEKQGNQPQYLVEFDVQRGSVNLVLFNTTAYTSAVGDATTPVASTDNAKEGTQAIKIDKSGGTDVDAGVAYEFLSAMTVIEGCETNTDFTEDAGASTPATESVLVTQGTNAVKFDKDATDRVGGSIYKDGLSLNLSGNEELVIDCNLSSVTDVDKVIVTLDESESVGTLIEGFESVTGMMAVGPTSGIAVKGTDKVHGTNSIEFDKDVCCWRVFEGFETHGDFTARGQASNIAQESTNVYDGTYATQFDKTGTNWFGAAISKSISSTDFTAFSMMGVLLWVNSAADAAKIDYMYLQLDDAAGYSTKYTRYYSYSVQEGWNWLCRTHDEVTDGVEVGAPTRTTVRHIAIGVFTNNKADTLTDMAADFFVIHQGATRLTRPFLITLANNKDLITSSADVSNESNGTDAGIDHVEFDKNGTTETFGQIAWGGTSNVLQSNIGWATHAEFQVYLPSLANIEGVLSRLGGTGANVNADYVQFEWGVGALSIGWNVLTIDLRDWDSSSGNGYLAFESLRWVVANVTFGSSGNTLSGIRVRPLKLYTEDSHTIEAIDDSTEWSAGGDCTNLGDESTTVRFGSTAVKWNKTGGTNVLSYGYQNFDHRLDLSSIKWAQVSVHLTQDIIDTLVRLKVELHGPTPGTDYTLYYFADSTLAVGWNTLWIDIQNPDSSAGDDSNRYIEQLRIKAETDNAADTWTDFLVVNDFRVFYWQPMWGGVFKDITSDDLSGYDRLRICSKPSFAKDSFVRLTSSYGWYDWLEFDISDADIAVGVWNYHDFDPASADDSLGSTDLSAITGVAFYQETTDEATITNTLVDNMREVVMSIYEDASPTSGWNYSNWELDTPTTQYGTQSLASVARLVLGVELNAISDTLSTIVFDNVRTRDPDTQDFSSYDIFGACAYLSSITSVENTSLKLIDDSGNWSRWDDVHTVLTAGWNDVKFSISATPDSTSGTLDQTDVRHLQLIVQFSAAANTLTGIVFDWGVGYCGKCIFTTHTVSGMNSAFAAQGCMTLPSETSQKADPEKGSTRISGVNFSLIRDANDEVLEAISYNEYRGRRLKLKMGFPGLDYADYRTVNTYLVKSISYDGGKWNIACNNDLAKLKEPFMTEATPAAPVTITANMITAWLQIMTSTGNGTNGAYDVLTASQGVGFPVDRLNLSEIESERDNWLSAYDTKFVFTKKEKDFKQWADKEIFRVCGAFQRIKDGLLTIKARRAPLASDSLALLNRSNIDKNFPRWKAEMTEIINRITFHFDYDEVDNEFDNDVTHNDTKILINDHTSQVVFGVKEIEIKTKGIKTTESTAMLASRAAQLFQRYSFGPQEVPLGADLEELDLGVGDIFTLTNSEIPDLENKQIGVTNEIMEIYELAIDHARGQIKLKAINSGYRRGRYALISPSTMTDVYDAASDADKGSYAWIADNTNFLGTGNDDAYEIQPG